METIKKTNSFLEILIFEEDSDNISESLGITDERRDELTDHLKDVLFKSTSKRVTDDLYQISLKVKHVNELSYLIYSYARFLESNS